MEKVTITRVYIREQEHVLDKVVNYLVDKAKIRGITVFRGIAGYGPSGKVLASHLVDISLDLPIVIEFFDSSNKIDMAIEELKKLVKPEHIISWVAECN